MPLEFLLEFGCRTLHDSFLPCILVILKDECSNQVIKLKTNALIVKFMKVIGVYSITKEIRNIVCLIIAFKNCVF